MELAQLTRQRQHPRHGHIVAGAVPLPVEILEKSLVACFQEQVARSNEGVAIQTDTEAITYAALNSAANRMARWLMQQPVDPSSPIAIMLGAGIEVIVALLAVLKAERAYMLFEPGTPPVRLTQLLQAAASSLLLARQSDLAQLDAALGKAVYRLALEDQPADMVDTNLDLPIAPDQPCRMQFSSGTTGTPKAVVKNHRQTLYSVWQYVNSYLCSPADRHALTYRMGSNAMTRVIFNPLLSGGLLHIPDEPAFGSTQFVDWLNDQKITTLYLPAVGLREIVNRLEGRDVLPNVRIIHVGGQTIHRRDALLFQERVAEGCILVCRYAMSEMGSLAHFLIDHLTVIDTPTIPAGYALPDREMVIVDEEGRDIGFDQPGEIAVHRLLPVEWDAENQSLATALTGLSVYNGDADLFRTADLGLLRPDGCLIHLGRKDDMVKVRGNRVALTEVENLLLQVYGVAQAAVRAFPTFSGDNRLAGYVTPAPDAQITVAGVREELSRLAPSYMIPAHFLVLPTMPFTTSGKIDRQALPMPGKARPNLNTSFIAPHSELEQQIADIWAELLELDEVGVEDNCFELGGDSLLAMRMVVVVEKQIDIKIPDTFFQRTTIRHMVKLLDPHSDSMEVDSADPANLLGSTTSTADGQQVDIKREYQPAIHRDQRPADSSQQEPPALRNYIKEFKPKTRLGRLLLNRGPSIGGVGLPYGLGVRLQRSLLQQPLIRHRLLSKQSQLFQQALDEADISDPEHEALIVNLMTNTWTGWRRNQLCNPQIFTRWVTVKGDHLIQSALAQGQGVITVFTHQSMLSMYMKQHLLSHGIQDIPTISGKGNEKNQNTNINVHRMQNALDALDILRQNGVVRIAGEGRGTSKPISISFYQRRLPLPIGFAELAQISQAPVVATHYEMTVDGRVTLVYTSLPTPAPNVSISALFEEYVTYLQTRWSNLLPTMGWPRLAYLASLPSIHDNAPGKV